jgi:hypothetical protein
MYARFSMPGGMIGVFNDRGIEGSAAEGATGSFTRKNEQFRANMLDPTDYCRQCRAFFLV